MANKFSVEIKMTINLLSSSPFRFDIQECLRSGFYISGTTGTGKSHLAMYCADLLMENGVNVIVFDPSEDWEVNSNISEVIRVEKLPLTLNLNINRSIVFDTKILTILQAQKFIEEFNRLIFEKQVSITREKRKPFIIILEEGQIVFPEGCLRAKRFQNSVRLLSVSRNFRIRVGVVTPFAAALDKGALRYMRQRYFGATDEKNDLEYIGSFVGKEVAETLRYLKAGEFMYYFPANNILEKITFDFHNRTVPSKRNGYDSAFTVEENHEENNVMEGENGWGK